MKTTKCVLAIALGVAALVPAPTYAGTITNYTINFTVQPGGLSLPSGSFTYDSTTPKFTNFLVTWDGFTFDLTNAANSPFIFGSGCPGEASTPAFSFAIMNRTVNNCNATADWFGIFDGDPNIPSSPAAFEFKLVAPGTFALIEAVNPAAHSLGTSGCCDFGAYLIQAQPTITPEPSAIILLGTGLVGLVAAARRKRLA